MTALAIALVLCCAMVCGTVLALRRMGHALHALERSPDIASVNTKVHLLDDAFGRHDKALVALRSEVDSLRAAVALRGM